MNSNCLNCQGQRELGIKLAKDAGAPKTLAAAEDPNCGLLDVLKAAIAESRERADLDILVTSFLQGPPIWAYTVLRFVPDLGKYRDRLLTKAAESPMSAFYTLRNVADIGDHREQLLKTVAKDAGASQMALNHLSDLGDHQEILKQATLSTPPVEVGGGYNTYFVNQNGANFWVMYNTGLRGNDSSIQGPFEILRGQNIGYGRGGLCISEMKAFSSPPSDWNDNGFIYWSPWPIDGCLSWGFRIANNDLAEAYAWAEGQPGMPGEYPPSWPS